MYSGNPDLKWIVRRSGGCTLPDEPEQTKQACYYQREFMEGEDDLRDTEHF